MDTAILSAASALLGSLIGGVSTLVASWLTQRGQLRAQAVVHEAVQRETLYAEFINEASKLLADAWSHQTESPEILAGLYSAIQRMRLTSSNEVVRAAEQVTRLVVESYAAPDKTFDDLRKAVESDEIFDPLREFSKVCSLELSALRG
jgi:hypothetical protein